MNKNPVILFLGDSITEGYAATKEENIYSSVCCKLLNAKKVSYGVGGTRIAEQKIDVFGDPKFNESFLQRAFKMQKEADVVVVFGGINDFGHGDAEMGNIESVSLFTFYGALKCLYRYLVDKYGREKVLVILPLHTAWDNSIYGQESKYKKVPSATLETYVDAIREVAAMYGLKIFDIRDELGVPRSTQCELYFADGLHPTDEGHKKIGTLLAEFINTHFVKKI